MSVEDDNTRVPLNAEINRTVTFPGEINRGPRAHVPGQQVERLDDGTIRVVRDGVPVIAIGNPYTNVASAQEVELQWKRLHPEARPLALGTTHAAGYDVATPEAVTLKPGERTRIPLGFALAIPQHLHGRIESRSGLAFKGLVVLTGVIDADYRGEVMVIMQNFSKEPYEFAAGDRVAQIVFRSTVHPQIAEVEELAGTDRGTGGFGSTGA